MGNETSSLSPAETEELCSNTHFSAKELKRLYKRFCKLDTHKNGGITVDDFRKIPELTLNPLMARVVSMFDTDKTHRVDFKEFVMALSSFSPRAPKEEKLRFAFRVFDINEDNFVSNEELFLILKMMVRSTLSDVQVQQIVDQTMQEVVGEKDGRLSFDDFCEALAGSDLEARMTIRF